MPQLDGLRALAVLAVVVRHGDLALPIPVADLAILGVELFFVLSGFLITGILLRSRGDAERQGTGMGAVARRFYVRRMLRIFPLYYLVIVAGLALDLSPAREAWPWLVTYTFNIYLAKLGWFTEYYPHLWTLAIEEQFYIVWPWLMLLLPRRWLRPAVGAAILVGPVFRFWVLTHASNEMQAYVLTPQYLDMLGMGALLAVVSQDGIPRQALSRIVLPAGVVAYFLFGFVPMDLPGRLAFAISDLPVALTFCALVGLAADGFGGAAGALLGWRPLRYIGEISYGVYVYHLFVPNVLMWTFARLHLAYPEPHWAAFVLNTTVTLFICTASWRWFERPIRDLGARIDARARRQAAPTITFPVIRGCSEQ